MHAARSAQALSAGALGRNDTHWTPSLASDGGGDGGAVSTETVRIIGGCVIAVVVVAAIALFLFVTSRRQTHTTPTFAFEPAITCNPSPRKSTAEVNAKEDLERQHAPSKPLSHISIPGGTFDTVTDASGTWASEPAYTPRSNDRSARRVNFLSDNPETQAP
eukprot:TRINITY_DN4479_c0_g2_i1.p1 TRINITY_DN4479_c0_g2~~TRINITY_DN4479_c0_g2_i1.p1  ORF type:complete len:162 (+),score=5.53 TRINITY_DN4479_c0_g2_i1:33-518(+)